MPTITDNAICIRRWDFSETSQTVSLFTQHHGILRGLAKGAKREKGDFSGGMDILTRGEVVAITKPGKDLSTLTAWHLQDMYRHLRISLPANRAALYMADLIHHMLIDHDPHPRVFDAMDKSLVAMIDPAAIEPALLTVQWRVLDEAGYLPELNRDAETGAQLPSNTATLGFSTAAGGVVADTAPPGTPSSPAAPGKWRVRRETIEVLRHAASGDDLSLCPAEALRRANRLLAVHCRQIIGSEPPAMRWAFSDLA